MNQKQLTWLHLSDLHAKTSDEWDSKEVIAKLVSDLRALQADEGLYPDFIIFSGDAAFGNIDNQTIADQYKDVGSFLDSVRKAFEPEIPLNHLYLVPGNHDVDRRSISGIETEWLRNPQRKEDEIINELKVNSITCRRWMERLAAYRQFLKDYGLAHLEPDDPHLLWAAKHQIHGLTVGIGGFNSAWSCASKDEKGKLWLGGRWQLAQLENRLQDVDLSIAVIHHPSNWFSAEDPSFGRQLRDKFNVVLHGHEHLETVSQEESGNILVSAGACYECSWMANGYNFGQINLDGTGGKIILRAWDNIGRGWVAKNIAKKAPLGSWSIKDVGLHKIGKSRNFEHTRIYRPSPILNLTTNASKEAIEKNLRSLQKRPLSFEIQHSRVRINERVEFERVLSEERFAWLISDWQMGKEGFISSTLNNLGSTKALENVYRVDCGQAESVDTIFDSAGTQLGIAFMEFAEIVRQSDQPTLILEDIPLPILRNVEEYGNLLQKINYILKFSPNLRIICILRQRTNLISDQNSVRLSAFDFQDVSTYLKSHPKSGSLSHRDDLFERIHSHTAGLPAAIDRLVTQSNLLPIEVILDENEEFDSASPEPIPQSLRDAVTSVFNPTNEKEIRSLMLLKLLTVLKDGETFQSVSRFYYKKPFYIANVFHLADLELIESVDIVQTGSKLIPKHTFQKQIPQDVPKLLRVPRQVREHVLPLITPEERSQIYTAASEALFGGKWYEGRINLRRSIITAYRQSSVAGPGNELVVAQYLLQTAIASGRNDRIERFARLAVGYCNALISQDRYRDAVIASGIVAKMLDGRGELKNWTSCATNYGRSLRMTGQYSEALKVIQSVLDRGDCSSNDFRAHLYLDAAWCHEALSENSACLDFAQKALEDSKKESDIWFQSKALIAEESLAGSAMEIALQDLAIRARNLKCVLAANNIALTLAKLSKSKKTSMKYLDLVLSSAKDMYNRSRAISKKADQLRETGRILELTQDERIALCLAYEYSYGQRINHLLDSCHDSIWDLCRFANFWVSLFRLYRYTSFAWAMSGRKKSDRRYKETLLDIKNSSDYFRREYVEIEVVYLESQDEDPANPLATIERPAIIDTAGV